MLNPTATCSLNDLSNAWRTRAVNLRTWAAADGPARALEQCAEELERALQVTESEVLTIGQAALESGYSTEQLRRLIRQGRLPNAGRSGSPRLRRADLPRRTQSRIVGRNAALYDAAADARSLLSRQDEG
jgi:hypothetical protein